MKKENLTFKETAEALMSGKIVKFDDILYKLAESGKLKYWYSDEWIDSEKFFSYSNDGVICPDPSIKVEPVDEVEAAITDRLALGDISSCAYEIIRLVNEKINKLSKETK